MLSGLTSGQVVRLRQCLQRGIAFENPLQEAQSSVIVVGLAAEIAARIAADAAEATTRATADTALQTQITDLQQPRYAPILMLGGM